MQNPSTPSPDAEQSQRNLRRLATIAVLIALLVFGIEFTLSRLRTRAITVNFGVALRFTPTPLPPDVPTPTATRTLDPRRARPTATATPLIPFLTAGDALVIEGNWAYRIGPRFQTVTLRARAYIPDREQPVAETTQVIDCGDAIVECNGDFRLLLNYDIPDPAAPGGKRSIPWPVGEYRVVVEQSAGANLSYIKLRETEFRVRP
jgi:hypothetical protein